MAQNRYGDYRGRDEDWRGERERGGWRSGRGETYGERSQRGEWDEQRSFGGGERSRWESGGYGQSGREERGGYGGQSYGEGYPTNEYGSRGQGGMGGGYGGQSYGEGYRSGEYGGQGSRSQGAMGGSAGQGYGEGWRGQSGGQRYGQGYGGYWGARGTPYGVDQSYSGQTYGQGYSGGQWYGGGQGGQGYGQTYGGEGGTYAGRRYEEGEDRSWLERAGDRMANLFGGDQERRGEHRGRGPKGYTRSDERIREDVNDRMTDDPWLDASEIDVQVRSCEVTLTGTVRNREDRRRAEDLAEQVSGVRHVQNNLRVQEQGASAGATAGRTGTTGTTGAAATSGQTGATQSKTS